MQIIPIKQEQLNRKQPQFKGVADEEELAELVQSNFFKRAIDLIK